MSGSPGPKEPSGRCRSRARQPKLDFGIFDPKRQKPPAFLEKSPKTGSLGADFARFLSQKIESLAKR